MNTKNHGPPSPSSTSCRPRYARLAVGCLLPLLLLPTSTSPLASQAPTCDTAEHDRAAFLVGDWIVDSEYRLGPGDWEHTSARSTISWKAGGCALVEEWSGEVQGSPLEQMSLLAYDHREETWDWVAVDSGHGNVMTAEGRFADDGRLVLLHSVMRQGRLLVDRITLAPAEAGGFDLLMESSPDAGGTWMAVWRMTYRPAG